jgi:hypothetical protein
MTNIAHAHTHRTHHSAPVFLAQSKSSVSALFARISSPKVRNAIQTTRIFRGEIIRKSFYIKDFRDLAFARVNFHRFPNFPGFASHRVPNFLWFARVSLLTSDSELYRSLRNASI